MSISRPFRPTAPRPSQFCHHLEYQRDPRLYQRYEGGSLVGPVSTVSSRMRDDDDDGAAILEGIRPWLPFRLSIFELRRQAIAWRSRRRSSKVPFLFPGPSIDSEVWNARRRCVFSF